MIFMNYNLLELEIPDSYKKTFFDNVSSCFFWQCFRVLECVKRRSSHRLCSFKKTVLRNFAIRTGKHLCWSIQIICLYKVWNILRINILSVLKNIILLKNSKKNQPTFWNVDTPSWKFGTLARKNEHVEHLWAAFGTFARGHVGA